MELLIVFVALNIFNVIIQTVKSIATIRCGPGLAALVNAVAYGFYTIVIVYMVCDLPLWQKVLVVALCNLIGVYIVKILEKRARKDRLWQLSITIPAKYIEELHYKYHSIDVSHNYINVGKWGIFTVYCETQKDTVKALKTAKLYNAKCFATENKLDL